MTERRSRIEVSTLPAEPGWRVVLTDGVTTFEVRVLGWSVQSVIWPVDDPLTHDTVDTHCEPLIVSEDGEYVMTAREVVMGMDDRWRTAGLLAPGQTELTDSRSGAGWKLAPHLTPHLLPRQRAVDDEGTP